jgi:kynurenine formamidase
MCSPEILAIVRERLHANGAVGRRKVLGATGAAVAGATMLPRLGVAQGATPIASPVSPGWTSVIDLTHLMTPETPVWPGNEAFRAEPVRTYDEHGFYAQALSVWEHTGTHVDAPAHFFDGLDTAEFLPVENFIAPLVVIDISARAAGDVDTALMVEDIDALEAVNGTIPDRAFVAMHSGWAAQIDDAEAFVNADADGVMHYPGFDPEASTFLVEQRNIVGIGVDTLSLDPGNSTTFGSHVAVLGASRYGIEGLANLDQAPASGATIVVGAPKHLNASGGPSRVFALV